MTMKVQITVAQKHQLVIAKQGMEMGMESKSTSEGAAGRGYVGPTAIHAIEYIPVRNTSREHLFGALAAHANARSSAHSQAQSYAQSYAQCQWQCQTPADQQLTPPTLFLFRSAASTRKTKRPTIFTRLAWNFTIGNNHGVSTASKAGVLGRRIGTFLGASGPDKVVPLVGVVS